uniref:E3 ubiquitin-protein ligase E3D n=1 Tax=Myxine glutinosa TaxID=7769 RepID=UPI0035901FCA
MDMERDVDMETDVDKKGDVLELDNAAFHMEIRRSRSNVHIVVRDVDALNGQVQIYEDSICFVHRGHSVRLSLPFGIRALPESPVSIRQVSGDGLHVTLRLQPVNSAFPVSCRRSLVSQLRNLKSFQISCLNCGMELLKPNSQVLRVLSLPSENWRAAVGSWHCNCHSNGLSEVPVPGILRPRVGDYLLGDTQLLLNAQHVASAIVSRTAAGKEMGISFEVGKDVEQGQRQENEMICSSCGSWLGKIEATGIAKAYLTEILLPGSEQFSKDDFRSSRCGSVESFIAHRLMDLSQSLSTFRFRVNTPCGHTTLLLWALNSDTLFISRLPTDTGIRPTITGHAVIKVLYSDSRSLACSWENDFKVQTLELPVRTCHELANTLQQSTSTMPPSLRSLNHFQVGYLRLEPAVKLVGSSTPA